MSGVHTDITPICEAHKQAIQDCDYNSASISFIKNIDGAVTQTLDTLNPSFMYTKILKKILLNIDFGPQYIIEFSTYYCEQFIRNTVELKNVDKIESEYSKHEPIWWYTFNCLLYFTSISYRYHEQIIYRKNNPFHRIFAF